jgi:ankyrin repeat protein
MKRILFSIVCISLISAGLAKADVSDKNAQLIQAAQDSNLPTMQTALAKIAEVNEKAPPKSAQSNDNSAARPREITFEDIMPVETQLEVSGSFKIIGNNAGGIQLIEGVGVVTKEGSFVKRGGIGGGPAGTSGGVAMNFMPGGKMKITLPKDSKVDSTYSIWFPGLVHIIQGNITNFGKEGYTFDSDPCTPLQFRVSKEGYTYVGGKGIVTTPSGKVENFNAAPRQLLIQAAKDGNLPAVETALSEGADVNVKNTDTGTTALWMASQNGHTEVVKLLLEKGANVNMNDTTYGTTALWIASQEGHAEVVKLLLEKGADVNAKRTNEGTTALWIASEKGCTEVAKLLLEKGADINVKRTSNGTTALWIASQNGHTEVVKLLLEKGADVNAKENDGTTALWIASQQGHTEVVKLLLEKGADVNVKKTDNGVTPLIAASVQGHTEVVKLLLEAKADFNVKASSGGKDYTPLSIAKEMGHTQIIELLEKAGAKE